MSLFCTVDPPHILMLGGAFGYPLISLATPSLSRIENSFFNTPLCSSSLNLVNHSSLINNVILVADLVFLSSHMNFIQSLLLTQSSTIFKFSFEIFTKPFVPPTDSTQFKASIASSTQIFDGVVIVPP